MPKNEHRTETAQVAEQEGREASRRVRGGATTRREAPKRNERRTRTIRHSTTIDTSTAEGRRQGEGKEAGDEERPRSGRTYKMSMRSIRGHQSTIARTARK